VMVSRVRRGVAPLSGGRDHLTHRLLGRLRTPRRVALALALAQTVLCGIGLGLLGSSEFVVIAVGIVYIGLGSLAIMVLDLSPALRPEPPPVGEPVARRMIAEPLQQESAP